MLNFGGAVDNLNDKEAKQPHEVMFSSQRHLEYVDSVVDVNCTRLRDAMCRSLQVYGTQ